ncbi:Major facilitator superfamily MFS_1 [Yersinia intermedia ATCC 29909]|nr:Major facilitator superfamily MFS_1 [Yersinia intermedia ATCC 29909]
MFAGNPVMKPFTSAVLYRFHFRLTLLVNGLLNAATIFACAFIAPETPTTLIIVLLFISGLTRSMQFTAFNTLAFSEVPGPKMAGTNTLTNMAQQMAINWPGYCHRSLSTANSGVVSSPSRRRDPIGKFPDSICGYRVGRITISSRYINA